LDKEVWKISWCVIYLTVKDVYPTKVLELYLAQKPEINVTSFLRNYQLYLVHINTYLH